MKKIIVILLLWIGVFSFVSADSDTITKRELLLLHFDLINDNNISDLKCNGFYPELSKYGEDECAKMEYVLGLGNISISYIENGFDSPSTYFNSVYLISRAIFPDNYCKPDNVNNKYPCLDEWNKIIKDITCNTYYDTNSTNASKNDIKKYIFGFKDDLIKKGINFDDIINKIDGKNSEISKTITTLNTTNINTASDNTKTDNYNSGVVNTDKQIKTVIAKPKDKLEKDKYKEILKDKLGDKLSKLSKENKEKLIKKIYELINKNKGNLNKSNLVIKLTILRELLTQELIKERLLN